jgi:hypothetical protein
VGKDTGVRAALDMLQENNLIIESEGQYLCLPVFSNRPFQSLSPSSSVPTNACTTAPETSVANALLRLV